MRIRGLLVFVSANRVCGECLTGRLARDGGRKIVLPSLLREKSSLNKDLNASCLTMGPGSVSRMISAGRTYKNVAKKGNELAEILFAEEAHR